MQTLPFTTISHSQEENMMQAVETNCGKIDLLYTVICSHLTYLNQKQILDMQ